MRKTLFLLTAALFSQGCTTVFYDSFVPARRMTLFVTDEAGRPLPQARLVVETRSFTSPKEGVPASGDGRIELDIPGYLHGGGGWILCGFISCGFGDMQPRERYRVMADGYRAVKFDRESFFADACRVTPEAGASAKAGDRVAPQPYRRTVVLRKGATNKRPANEPVALEERPSVQWLHASLGGHT